MEFMTAIQSGLDEQKPSLFELLSEQQLSSLIPPSLRYLLVLATHRHPRYLLRILNSFDEVYALLSLLVERHYLRTYGGSFTENFYGLKRERVLRIRNGEVPRAALGAPEQVRESLGLTNADVWKNLAVIVGLPYLKRKLDEAYDIHAAHVGVLNQGPQYAAQGQDASHVRDLPFRKKILLYYKWFLRHVYPSVNAAYYFAMLAFNLSYLFDGTKFHSPFMFLIGGRIRRMNVADHRAIALATQPRSSTPVRPGQAQAGLLSARTLTHILYPRVLSGLKILLPTSIFALKFLEWWHASDFARQLAKRAHETLDLPAPIVSGLPDAATSTSPPATSEEKHQKHPASTSTMKPVSRRSPPIAASSLLPILTVPPAYSSELCPICLAPITVPTASQAGYVYCYTCIHRWVEGTHERQERFMAGSEEDGEGGAQWDDGGDGSSDAGVGVERVKGASRLGRWESGAGRDAVTGRRVLGGSSGLRRVMV